MGSQALPTRMSEAPTKRRAINGNSEATSVSQKDDLELRLEKAVFGDEAGFLHSLKPQDRSVGFYQQEVKINGDEDSAAEGSDEDLSNLPDEDLFFLDPGNNSLPAAISKQLEDDSQDSDAGLRKPIWYDSDDDRIRISLASNTRLRKLRNAEHEDVVSGREYIKRLRLQFEQLHPTPSWVSQARNRIRNPDVTANRDIDESDSEMSLDDENTVLSARPLADLLQSTGDLTYTHQKSSNQKLRRKLRVEVIDIQRTKDVTSEGPSSVDSLQFHRSYPLLLAAGPSSTINLYRISPQPPNSNPLVTSLHVKGTPLRTAAFYNPPSNSITSRENDPTRILFSSRRRYFHDWSLSTGVVTKISRAMYGETRQYQRTMELFKPSPCGQYIGLIGSTKKGGGVINVLSTDSFQWICSCRVDSGGGIADFVWWNDSTGFCAIGKNGEVNEYDLKEKRVIKRWIDEGAIGTTVIALGADSNQIGLGGSRWVAVGSSSGIVNIYDRRGWKIPNSRTHNTTQDKYQPVKVFDQLTTPVSYLEFSSDGQMLVMASRWKKNALRLIHLPSYTVYRNWPTDKTPLGRISSVALSPEGSYLAVGNEQGKIRLWEIRG